MKSSLFLSLLSAVLASLKCTTAFSIVNQPMSMSMSMPSTAARSRTVLQYTVIPGIEEEEADGDSEQNEMRKKIGVDKYAAESMVGYNDYNELDDTDEIGVDSFKNKAGGNIMPGFHLTALCGDD